MNSSPNTTIMIQARTGSKRLPKKVLLQIQKKPLLYYVISRIKKVKKSKKIIVLTTRNDTDSNILRLAKKLNVSGFAGDTNDVLSRFYDCAVEFNADPIVRITGDCPLIDYTIIDELLEIYLKNNYDYVTNTLPPTFPDGLDVEIFSFKTLEIAHKYAKLKSEREHVTPYIRKNPKKFKIFNLTNDVDLSHLRWTVDEELDLKFVRRVYSLMKPKKFFNYKKILKLLQTYPALMKINNQIMRNEGYFQSLKND